MVPRLSRFFTLRKIFGDADDNVGYVFFVKEDLEKAGHFVELSFATRKTTMQNLDKIIIANEVLRRKNAQMEGLKLEERKVFVQNWYKEHEGQIVPQLGSSADENRLQFLNGIFFDPSFVKQTVPQLQKVSWPTHAIYTSESIRCFLAME
jgi:hypothetical protein